MKITDYIRNRAKQLRTKFDGRKTIPGARGQPRVPTETEIGEALAAARQLEIVADEIDAGMADE